MSHLVAATRRVQTFDLPVEPTPKARPRFAGGHAFTPARTRVASDAISDILRMDGAYMYDRDIPLYVQMTFVRTAPKTPRAMPTVKPDLDQFLKLVMDAGNGVLWADDSQICELRARKVYGQSGKIKLEVGPLV